jgi:electron transfer flavoprotein beta subunit
LNIVTFTRSTPDTAAKVEVGSDGAVTWTGEKPVVNPWDEYSLEESIVQAKAAGGKAVVIAVGGDLHNDALKTSIAMGLDEAYRIDDSGLSANDSLSYATAAAAAVNKVGDVALVLFGKESVDVGTDQHVIQTARKLGWTMLSYVSKILSVDYAAKTVQVEKSVEGGKQVITAALPVVMSVLKDINEPRYPSFLGIRKAAKAVVPVWTLADLGIEAPTAKTTIDQYRSLPPRSVQVEMIAGEPTEIAAQLVDKLLAEKVL